MNKVLIVDDERNIHKAFGLDILKASDRYQLVDCLLSAGDALMVCESKNVDLILMDINTYHNESGLEATKIIKAKYPSIKIIITTSYFDHRAIKLAKEAQANALWYKDFSQIELLEVMDKVMKSEEYWPIELPDVQIGEALLSELTPSEKEVLYALPDCVSIRNIAERLFIEENTVKTHLKNIYAKTGCNSKAELLVKLLQSKSVLPK